MSTSEKPEEFIVICRRNPAKVWFTRWLGYIATPLLQCYTLWLTASDAGPSATSVCGPIISPNVSAAIAQREFCDPNLAKLPASSTLWDRDERYRNFSAAASRAWNNLPQQTMKIQIFLGEHALGTPRID
ncbi:unnamed protein product [Clavelina lepadiformis]|uniref:Uncharacterized protein n=1 Tax=Clavelina lepadiformis TaxID=159417 RepID=A0ABP0GH89_CLALP